MSGTPQVIIIAWRKLLHDTFGAIGGLFALGTALSYLMDGNYLLPAAISVVALVIASNIKFRWVKRGEVSVYE